MRKILPFILVFFIFSCAIKEAFLTREASSIPVKETVVKSTGEKIRVLELFFNAPPLYHNSAFYLHPLRIERGEEIEYSEDYPTMIKNYFLLHVLGTITDKETDADYYITSNVQETFKSFLLKNYSLIEVDVFTKLKIPLLHVVIKVESRRNKSFFYNPSTPSQSPDYLTHVGFIYLLDNVISKMFVER